VQTRAFSSLYLAGVAVAALWSGRDDLFASLARLPQLARHVLAISGPMVQRLGENRSFDRFYFLGSGPRYGLACELSLKMKEMSLSHSEPFHFLEFRHGPRAMVTTSTLAVGLVSRERYAHEHTVLSEIRVQGGSILEIGDEGEGVAFQSMLDEAIHSVLFLPVGQLLALARATSKGLNPDRPNNLTAVIRLP
jgi:glucosamine--fructose-6-phosphate aminotransferase (isomerizing)